MNRRRSGLILIGLGLVLACVAAAVVIFIATRGPAGTAQPAGGGQSQTQTRTVKVVVALTDILDRTQISASQVKEQDVPENLVPAEALRTVNDAVGKTTVQRITQNQILTQAMVGSSQGSGGTAFSFQAPNVLVAVTFNDAADILAAGAIRPGDFVDLVVLGQGDKPGNIPNMQVQVTVRNLQVYAIGQARTAPSQAPAAPSGTPASAQQGTSGQPAATQGTGTTILFVVPEQDALVIKYHEQPEFHTDMFLRAAGDSNIYDTDPVDVDYIVQRYKLKRPTGVVPGASPTTGPR